MRIPNKTNVSEVTITEDYITYHHNDPRNKGSKVTTLKNTANKKYFIKLLLKALFKPIGTKC